MHTALVFLAPRFPLLGGVALPLLWLLGPRVGWSFSWCSVGVSDMNGSVCSLEVQPVKELCQS